MDPVTGAIFSLGAKLIDTIFPDPEKKAAAQLELLRLQQSGELAKISSETQIAVEQIKVNQESAKSTNWFVAGARPFIMWGCGFAMLYVGVVEPICRFIAQVVYGYTGAFPVIDTTLTTQVLLGLLGLGGMRTYEKLKGAESNR